MAEAKTAWFKITLYTPTPEEQTSYIDAIVSGSTDITGDAFCKTADIAGDALRKTIVECTANDSSYFIVTVSPESEIKAKPKNATEVMAMSNTINIDEGTVHYVTVSAYDGTSSDEKTPLSLTNYSITVYVNMGEGKFLQSTKQDNVVNFTIPPSMTVGKTSGVFEVRAFNSSDSKDVRQIAQGNININRSNKPIIEYVAPDT